MRLPSLSRLNDWRRRKSIEATEAFVPTEAEKVLIDRFGNDQTPFNNVMQELNVATERIGEVWGHIRELRRENLGRGGQERR